MGELADRLAAGDVDILTEEELSAFVATRRWFGGRSREISEARLADLMPLPSPVAPLALGLVEVRYQTGTHDMYQVVVGVRPSGGGGAEVITERGAEEIVDALDNPQQGAALLGLVLQGVTVERGEARLAATWSGTAAAAQPARRLGADQTNTGLVVGDVLLKSYRHLHAGVNPELELLRFLSEHGFAHVPELLGWYERTGPPIEATLGIAVRYLSGALDGFTMTLDALGTDPGSVLPRLRRLGQVTGRMQEALSSDTTDPRFSPEEPGPGVIELIRASVDEEIVELFARLTDHEDLSALAARVEEVRDRLASIEPSGDLGRRIRMHGDYHLGQALWHEGDWVLIDFEGEPARPIEERRRKRLPLRDVAGMLRSISYAGWVARLDRNLEIPDGWEEQARAAFLEGYMEVMTPLRILPSLRETLAGLLDLFELEKGVYELRYELNHRPHWASIPAAGIAQLLGRETP